MRLKQIVAAVLAGFFSFVIYAETTPSEAQQFQTLCTDTWMKKLDDVTDKVTYKKLGKKYCDCAARQSLEDDADVQKAIRLCMSKTLLHDAMESLENEIGIAKAKDTDIIQYCQNRWALVDPDQTDHDREQADDYCNCVKPNLRNLIKKSENMTDKQYDDSIDTIASDCSDSAIVQQPL